MITKETAAMIWHAYREIETGEKLLADIEKENRFRTENEKKSPSLKDAFGNRRNLQLGMPSGDNGHRLFDVSERLADSVIRAHIANKRLELAEANERARIELIGDAT